MRNGERLEFHKSEFLYNGHRVKEVMDLVVVESFTAVWWLTEADIANVVAVMGASVSEKQAKQIDELVPEDGRVWLLPMEISLVSEWWRARSSSSRLIDLCGG